MDADRRLFRETVARLADAKLAPLVRLARVFVDDCIARLLAGVLHPEVAAIAKWWVTDTQQRALGECVQLHGRYGYMNEYLVCRLFGDSRVQRIYGGTNEIMNEFTARSLMH